jgi:ATP-dependent Lhr-like helicase
VVYVSPLKALGNDVQKNLLAPLEADLRARGPGGPLPRADPGPGADRRHAGERARQMLVADPHVLITTPESLYLVLTRREGARRCGTWRRSSWTRSTRWPGTSVEAISPSRSSGSRRRFASRPQLIGLSATQKPVETFASFLTGRPEGCSVVQVGHLRKWQLSLETPEDDLSAVATHEMWGQVYDRLVQLTSEHRTTLIFTNTRKLAERVAHDLGTRLGRDRLGAPREHGAGAAARGRGEAQAR